MAKLPDISEAIAFDENLREIPRWPERIAYAIRRGRKQLQQARTDRNETQILRTLGYLTDACRVSGELDTAVTYGQEAVELSRATGNRNAEVANLIRLGEVHKYRNESAIAEPLFRNALELTVDGDAEVLRDFALHHLGTCLLEMGGYDEATTYLEQALTLRQAKNNQSLIESTGQALELARIRRDTHAT